MAKSIIVAYAGGESSFAISKVDRTKLYPTRKRVPLDAQGQPCTRASMTSDGANVLKSGMTAQGYFTTAGRWVPKEELVGINPDGSLTDLKASTLGVSQMLKGPVSERELLDLEVASIYLLEPETVAETLLASLQQGDLYQFAFNYGTGYSCEIACLLANDEGIFAVVGSQATPAWIEEPTVFVTETEEDSSADEFDFEMV
jgi:hypothetical protein